MRYRFFSGIPVKQIEAPAQAGASFVVARENRVFGPLKILDACSYAREKNGASFASFIARNIDVIPKSVKNHIKKFPENPVIASIRLGFSRDSAAGRRSSMHKNRYAFGRIRIEAGVLRRILRTRRISHSVRGRIRGQVSPRGRVGSGSPKRPSDRSNSKAYAAAIRTKLPARSRRRAIKNPHRYDHSIKE